MTFFFSLSFQEKRKRKEAKEKEKPNKKPYGVRMVFGFGMLAYYISSTLPSR